MRAAALLVVLTACTGGGTDAKEPVDESQITIITSAAQIPAAENQVVRLQGRLFHEKLGDGVYVDGTAILCPDLRLPDVSIEVTLQGRLELWMPPIAEVGAAGEISQGVGEADASRWILRDCKQV